jgi:predicted ATPase
MITIEQTCNHDNFFVLTGGPGVGKTTLLSELEKKKFKCVPEVAREIIKEQMKIEGEALPWKNKELFKQLMHERSIDDYKRINDNNNKIIFFDRGILDTLSYTRLINLNITEEMNSDAKHYRYNKKVFILPPWVEIYETDSERKQSWEEAVQTYEMIINTYKEYNYEILEVPQTPINKRVDFILENIKSV